MNTRLLTRAAVAAFAVFLATPALAQLAAPNASGAAIGHIHYNVSDVDAQVHFWTNVGGKIVQREKLTMVQFPGIYVLLRKQDYKGGSAGSTVDHFGLNARDVEAAVAKWKAGGLEWEPVQSTRGPAGFLKGPDSVLIEIHEDKSLSVPLQMDHIHMYVVDPVAAQKWYVQHFGAIAGKRGQFETAMVPGTEITLAKADAPRAPTKGRSLDHIGFEVKNVDAFMARLQAAGIKPDGAVRNSPNASGLRIVYVTDPWGTEIELTEGLAPAP